MTTQHSTGHLYLQIQKWKYICERDRQETLERVPVSSPPAHCEQRMSDLYAGMDDQGRYATQHLEEIK